MKRTAAVSQVQRFSSKCRIRDASSLMLIQLCSAARGTSSHRITNKFNNMIVPEQAVAIGARLPCLLSKLMLASRGVASVSSKGCRPQGFLGLPRLAD